MCVACVVCVVCAARSSISLSKLAALMDVDEGSLRTQLLCLKHKQRQLKWDGGKDMTTGGCPGRGGGGGGVRCGARRARQEGGAREAGDGGRSMHASAPGMHGAW